MVHYIKFFNLDPYLGMIIFKAKLTHGKSLCIGLLLTAFPCEKQQILMNYLECKSKTCSSHDETVSLQPSMSPKLLTFLMVFALFFLGPALCRLNIRPLLQSQTLIKSIKSSFQEHFYQHETLHFKGVGTMPCFLAALDSSKVTKTQPHPFIGQGNKAPGKEIKSSNIDVFSVSCV